MKKHIEQITPEFIEERCHNGACKVTDGFVLFDRCEDLPFAVYPRQLNAIMILLCLNGRMHLRYAYREYELKRNDSMVLISSQVIDDYYYSNDCQCIAIYGTEDFFQEMAEGWQGMSALFLFIRNKAVVSFTEQEACIFRNYFKAIQDRAHWREHRFLRRVTSFLLGAMVLDLGHLIWGVQNGETELGSKRTDKLFTDFVCLVEKNFRKNRRVSWYAERLNISPKYLLGIVKTASGQTPNEWIDKYVVMEVRCMLRNTTLSVKEIAEELNFPNQSFLGKYFKQHTGLSPSAYRKQ